MAGTGSHALEALAGSSGASSSTSRFRVEHALGSFIEHPQLTQLSAMLKAVDAGDRIIKGRLELFACSKRRLSHKQQTDLQRRDPHSLTDSPLGPMASDGSQGLLANLSFLMSLLFVDYDCTSIMPRDFEVCADKHAVVSAINHNLASVVERVHSGFMTEFWQAVQDSIDVANCEILSFKPTSGNFEPSDNSLMACHYFFVDVRRGRILFIGCVTKTRGTVRGLDGESDVTLSQDSASSKSSKDQGSSMGSSLQEGDLAFASDGDSDDDAMMMG